MQEYVVRVLGLSNMKVQGSNPSAAKPGKRDGALKPPVILVSPKSDNWLKFLHACGSASTQNTYQRQISFTRGRIEGWLGRRRKEKKLSPCFSHVFPNLSVSFLRSLAIFFFYHPLKFRRKMKDETVSSEAWGGRKYL